MDGLAIRPLDSVGHEDRGRLGEVQGMVELDVQLAGLQVSVPRRHAREERPQIEFAVDSLAHPRVPELRGPPEAMVPSRHRDRHAPCLLVGDSLEDHAQHIRPSSRRHMGGGNLRDLAPSPCLRARVFGRDQVRDFHQLHVGRRRRDRRHPR